MNKFNSSTRNLPTKNTQIKIVNGIIAGEQQNERDLSRIIMADYTTRVSTLETAVNDIERDVSVIKSNYLTKNTFYASCVTGIILAVAAGWAAYSNLDGKIVALSDNVNQRFQQVEEKVHSLDVRLTKVEMRLDNVDKKLDKIDDKLELLIQQKQAKK